MKTKPQNNLYPSMLKLGKTSRGLWLACAAAAAFCLGQPVKAQISDGLVSYWPLDEVVENRTPDLVSGYDLELANLTADDFIDGRAGRAFLFDSTRETLLYRVHSPGERLPINQHPALTISFWANVKGTGLTDLRMFSESSNRDNDPLFNIGTANNGDNDAVNFFFRQSGWVDVNHLRTMGEPLDGTWHHLTFVQQEDGTRALYIDGVEDGVVIPAKEPGDWWFNITTLGGILRADSSHWLTGAIDEVALWSRPLTADEVLALANTPLSSLLGEEAGFVLDPSSLTIFEGQDFTLSLAVKGEPPISVQWYKGSEPIPSATHLTFPVINATAEDSGDYHAIAYNAFGIATSDVAVVEVQAGDFGPEVHFHETFETSQALDDWTWDAAWEIGEPTSGPGRAFNGSKCAATVLGGNYADNMDARLVSPGIVVPDAALNPRLRFWHWYSFNGESTIDGGDYGQVQIRVDGGSWQNLSPIYANTSSGVYSRPSLDLSAYAGRRVELAFYLHTRLNSSGAERTSSGWYIDEVRLLHDSALALTESVVVRNQETACIPISIAANSPASTVIFALHAPAGNLGDLTLDMDECWAGSTITPQGDTEWLVTLRNNCPETHMGLRAVGTLCFRAASAQSAFVPLTIGDLSVTYQDGSLTTPIHGWGNRAVVIANEPLLEAWKTASGERMVTLFGKPFTTYDIRESSDITTLRPWNVGWAETVPFDLFLNVPMQGEMSSEPILFLDATEQ